jgi:transcriptional regulator with XRE-family HTH domain
MWIQQRKYTLVGRVLKVVKEAANLTQTALAERLSKPQSFVSSCEAGQRRIDVLELQKVAEAVGLDPVKLYSKILTGVQSKSTGPKNYG